MEKRHYHLALTDEERAAIVAALRTVRDFASMATTRLPGALAERIEHERGEEDILSLATSRLRAWYYGRVRDLAVDVLEEIAAGRIDTTDALQDYVRDSVDGTDIVVYTYKARAALLASDNEDAFEDIFGHEGGTPEQRAYCALEADVWELLRAGPCGLDVTLPDGFDVDDESTWTETSDEDEAIPWRFDALDSEGTADQDEVPQ